MRKLFLTAVGAATLALGSTAANASVQLAISSADLNTFGSSAFTGQVVGTGASTNFNDIFAFTLTNPDLLNGHVDTLAILGTLNINFSSIYIDTVARSFTQTGFDPGEETWVLNPGTSLAAGPHNLFVNGSLNSPVGTAATYSGTLNIAAVPEPATWAMMLLGFGGIGLAMRRKRRPALAQIA
ncbi:MAG: FxDxF family PEP-CTERM protein [Sphingomicrobium sp.]